MWKFIAVYFKKENEKKIPTTIKLLKKMIEAKKPLINPLKEAEFKGTKGDEIYFEHRDVHFAHSVPLKTIRYIGKDRHGYYEWRASQREYEEVYERNDMWGDFIKKELKPMIAYLDEKKDEKFYQYILEEHYSQILLVSESINEIEELEEYIPNDVAEKCIYILRELFTEIKEVRKKYKQNILKKLDEEIQYLNNNTEISSHVEQKKSIHISVVEQ